MDSISCFYIHTSKLSSAESSSGKENVSAVHTIYDEKCAF